MIRSIYDEFFEGRRVLIRADFNVPLTDDRQVADDTRITATLPTIDKIIDDGGIPVIMSHLGRPKGEPQPEYSLKPVALHLQNKLGYSVIFASDCIGEVAENAVRNAAPGDIVILENLRFHKEEKANDSEFAAQLAKLGDMYVNDAFGSAHRAHASTVAAAKLFKQRYAGQLMMDEINNLNKALKNPQNPFVAVIGGAKISGKIDVIKNLYDKCDTILIGGGMSFTFYKAQGLEIGNSILEEDKIDLAKELISEADKKNVKLLLPDDVVVAADIKKGADHKTVDSDSIPADMSGVDIGEKTREKYSAIIRDAMTIVWNGPMGVFEIDEFAIGTEAIAKAMADATGKGAKTIIGGGDSASAVKKLGFEGKVTHVSTGGGASLEFLEGKKLPGIEALNY
ncbi:MAG: phosphoglycerate kinase [Candidatus Kapaibacterium sp.]